MSVLYKALQKAQKENEERQPTAGSASAGATTSAMKLAMPGVNWRVAGLGLAVVLAAVIGGAFFLFDSSAPAPQQQAARPAPPPAMTPPAPAATTPTATPAETAVATAPATPATTTPVAAAPTAPPAASAPTQVAQAIPAPAAPVAAPAAPAPTPAADTAPADASQPISLTPKAPAKAAAPKPAPAAPSNSPMPQLAADSPARVLSPPIAIKRDEYDFSGVGESVQVRRVSQQAQDNVTAGYNALVRGDHAIALGFYDRALQQEPRSVLAQLGRGAALQKMGDLAQARTSYERVLKVDPNNREALTNLTAIIAEREPGEALRRLQELEKEYPSFSPVKAQLGLTYAKMGQFETALDYLRRAVNLTPDAPMYNYNLALVLDRLDRKEQAVASYERVLSAAAGGRIAPEISVADIERRVRYLRAK